MKIVMVLFFVCFAACDHASSVNNPGSNKIGGDIAASKNHVPNGFVSPQEDSTSQVDGSIPSTATDTQDAAVGGMQDGTPNGTLDGSFSTDGSIVVEGVDASPGTHRCGPPLDGGDCESDAGTVHEADAAR